MASRWVRFLLSSEAQGNLPEVGREQLTCHKVALRQHFMLGRGNIHHSCHRKAPADENWGLPPQVSTLGHPVPLLPQALWSASLWFRRFTCELMDRGLRINKLTLNLHFTTSESK